MDGVQVWVVVVDDDDNIDAQVFQTETDAQHYCVKLVLAFLSDNPALDTDYDDSDIGYSDAISHADDTYTSYQIAQDFLNDWAIEELGLLIVERHIHRKGN